MQWLIIFRKGSYEALLPSGSSQQRPLSTSTTIEDD